MEYAYIYLAGFFITMMGTAAGEGYANQEYNHEHSYNRRDYDGKVFWKAAGTAFYWPFWLITVLPYKMGKLLRLIGIIRHGRKLAREEDRRQLELRKEKILAEYMPEINEALKGKTK